MVRSMSLPSGRPRVIASCSARIEAVVPGISTSQLATAFQPVSALVHGIYGTFYPAPLGRLQEAVEELERAVEEEPLHALLRSELAFALLEAGSEDRAIAEFRKVMEIDEGFWDAHRFFGGL